MGSSPRIQLSRFLAAVLEAIASRQQPLECSGEMQGVLAEPALGDVDSQALTRAHVPWTRRYGSFTGGLTFLFSS